VTGKVYRRLVLSGVSTWADLVAEMGGSAILKAGISFLWERNKNEETARCEGLFTSKFDRIWVKSPSSRLSPFVCVATMQSPPAQALSLSLSLPSSHLKSLSLALNEDLINNAAGQLALCSSYFSFSFVSSNYCLLFWLIFGGFFFVLLLGLVLCFLLM
jgi:hypothetical protein